MTARYLSNLAAVLSPEGVIPAAKGGTGTTTGGSSGPKISVVTVTDSSYNVLDDTAVDPAGGYIKITGSGFVTGCQVLVNTTAATSVTFISATEVRAQVPATAAGTYIVYVINSDGGVAIRVNGITFSATPTWTSTSPLSGAVNAAISIQLTATGAATFALASGSMLPSGVSLSSSGLLTGTVTGVSTETTYNFTVVATDAELQDSPRAFAFTISVGDPYFMYNTLLLSGTGTNTAQNNTYLDSSTNAFSITRNGNPTQGTFSPYGPNWSNYFDGTGDYLTAPNNAAFNFGTGDFTVECWVYVKSFTGSTNVIISTYQDGSNGWTIGISGNIFYAAAAGDTAEIRSSVTPPVNIWTHLALTRSSTTLSLFINGVVAATQSNSTNMSTTSAVTIGTNVGGGALNFAGYISNLRIVKGTAVYTSNFTPSTTPLTAITNTSLLTCKSNRFIDNSTNAFAITASGNTNVQRFSPFSPGTEYSTSTIGGSGYFDGSGDFLTTPSNVAFNVGNTWTVECWYYPVSKLTDYPTVFGISDGSFGNSIVLNERHGGAPTKFSFSVGTYDLNPSTTDVIDGRWYHLALVSNNGVVTMYVNGTAEVTSNKTAGSSNKIVYIGTNYDHASYSTSLNGYISNLRIVKSTAVYTANFTPPTAPLTAIANTSLLTNFTNAAIVDNTMLNNLETVGNAQISTAQSKFGGSSMYFDGTGDYLKIPFTPNLQFGSGSFTIEAWIYPTSVGSYPMIASQYGGSSFALFFSLSNAGTKLDVYLYAAGGGSVNFSTTNDVTLNTWNHVALVRNGNTVTIYINGISGGSITYTASLNNITIPITIGADATGTYPFFGYIDDFRVTKGLARYTANFTPPSLLLTQ